jgi:hypothetical protein
MHVIDHILPPHSLADCGLHLIPFRAIHESIGMQNVRQAQLHMHQAKVPRWIEC